MMSFNNGNMNVSYTQSNATPLSGSNSKNPVLDYYKIVGQNKSISLPNGSQIYVFGEDNGGNGPQSLLSSGNVTYATTASNDTGAQISISKHNSSSISNSPSNYYTLAGFGVSGFKSYSVHFGFNNNTNYKHYQEYYNRTLVYNNFTVNSYSLVVFMVLASSQDFISLSGISGLIIDKNTSIVDPVEGTTGNNTVAVIAHAYLEPGKYSLVALTVGYTDGQPLIHMADILGAFIFSSNSQSSGISITELYAIVGIVIAGSVIAGAIIIGSKRHQKNIKNP
ncbi:MAG: hypothetical protein M1496_01695 [Candidatus Thermoplasmatota archaeon]|nr:hypothetical protein [Candidatus Thermoplasmatota archaeon]